MPSQSLLIEGNDHLRAASVGFTGRNQVSFIGVFPKEKKQRGRKQYSNCGLASTTNPYIFISVQREVLSQYMYILLISKGYNKAIA